MTENSTEMGKLRELNVEAYLADCVQMEPLAIEEEFVRMPADLAYWNERYATAYKGLALAEQRRRKLEALLRIEYREKMLADQKKPTESMVDAAVATDDRMLAARDDQIMAEVEKVRIQGVCEAVRCKKDMLISMGAHMRAEMNGDPTIRAQARDQRTIRQG